MVIGHPFGLRDAELVQLVRLHGHPLQTLRDNLLQREAVFGGAAQTGSQRDDLRESALVELELVAVLPDEPEHLVRDENLYSWLLGFCTTPICAVSLVADIYA